MPRRKAAQAHPENHEPRTLRKRPHDAEAESTPSKRRRGSAEAPEAEQASSLVSDDMAEDGAVEPPKATPRRRGRGASAPSKPTRPVPATPVKVDDAALPTPRRQAADRSARRKSARALIEKAERDGASDDDDDALAREIYEDGDSEAAADDDEAAADDGEAAADDGEAADDDDGVAQDSAPVDDAATPSKTPRRGRRPRARSPTPPRDLPAHELYFADNRPGRPKTSDATLGSLALLTHDEYFAVARALDDGHAADVAFLEALHAESFPQWAFELAQGFSLCLYGLGSKRALLRVFARHLHAARRAPPRRTVVVNGYAPAAGLRDVLAGVAAAVDARHRVTSAAPAAMAQAVAALLSAADVALTLVVNSIDAPPLRRPGAQAALAHLAAHPRVRLVCSADTPDFPLLWDVGVRSAFNFVFHDCTTFAPLAVELDAVDDVHQLLGRAARRVSGRHGVAFVLRSLPDNARSLFRLLVAEVLVATEDEAGPGDEAAAVEYRIVYHKAVEEFICTSEMAFRTLLKEFHDHQMITSRKDALGTELLSVPFDKEELEAILEDLTA